MYEGKIEVHYYLFLMYLWELLRDRSKESKSSEVDRVQAYA